MVISHDGWIARGTRGVVRLECFVAAKRSSTICVLLARPNSKNNGIVVRRCVAIRMAVNGECRCSKKGGMEEKGRLGEPHLERETDPGQREMI